MEARFEHVDKRFGEVEALRDLNLVVGDGSFLVMLGPSGCGKTTALRVLAGLEHPSARDRDIAMVFQSYALYPQMSVRDNIAYPLRVRKTRKNERDRLATDVAERLGIDELLERRPRELSGGQRQRVALARAIIRHPAIFLMDEPLSNLDAQLRVQM
jgi:multiple sugar transport system ATP-binding protein